MNITVNKLIELGQLKEQQLMAMQDCLDIAYQPIEWNQLCGAIIEVNGLTAFCKEQIHNKELTVTEWLNKRDQIDFIKTPVKFKRVDWQCEKLVSLVIKISQ